MRTLFFLLLMVVSVSILADEIPVSFNYQDVTTFNRILATAEESDELSKRIASDYLSDPTPALADYVRRYSLDASSWVEAVNKTPRFYAGLHDLEARLKGQESAIKKGFDALQQLYGLPIPPVVNYLIGPYVAGGITDNAGVIIAAEVFSLREDGNHYDLDPRRRLLSPDLIPAIVIHEYAHALQIRLQGDEIYDSIYDDDKTSLLKLCLREGAADFIAFLATGTTMNEAAHAFGDSNLPMLWQEFQERMHGASTDEWLFYPPEEHADWPIDLGYYMGFKIVQAFYEQHQDKAAALHAILNLTDYDEFLEQANFSPAH